MRARVLLLLGLAVGLLGCATHYHRQRGREAEFYLRAPGARQVALVTSLDDFTPHPARRVSAAAWHVALPADRPFRYFYLVDGEPFLPDCAETEADDFGGSNCIFSPSP
jgi:hypothetical protein